MLLHGGGLVVALVAEGAYKIGNFDICYIAEEKVDLSSLNMDLAGSPIYTSPEMQARFFKSELEGKINGPIIDTFSLGVTLYHCLYGAFPFRNENGEDP